MLTLGLGGETSGCCEHAVSSRVCPILVWPRFPPRGFFLSGFAHPIQAWDPSARTPLAGLGDALCPLPPNCPFQPGVDLSGRWGLATSPASQVPWWVCHEEASDR